MLEVISQSSYVIQTITKLLRLMLVASGRAPSTFLRSSCFLYLRTFAPVPTPLGNRLALFLRSSLSAQRKRKFRSSSYDKSTSAPLSLCFLYLVRSSPVCTKLNGRLRFSCNKNKYNRKEFLIMFKYMREDIASVFENDPAARSKIEVVLTYAGLHAIWSHRMAHFFFKKKLYFIARVISQV